ncbi:RagB/SusD family nutrient uptake outer membrane protein [Olivibacter sitiensis]|uniref:RagB/SusD family nutrient uptake outer membrane protein n=1 Tax=Olivibacter sitiensis TaxID=376470 RepID=UPI0004288A85|nr:RagB/SusD family nutrient uptake outer membrane protein [Olivibacter sitiensis]
MKKTVKKFPLIAITAVTSFLITSCEKYLNEPSNKSLAIITNLEDLQALLDHTMMNSSPLAPEISADNYYLTDDGWESLELETDKNMYIWAENNVFQPGIELNDWTRIYQPVYYANTVLEHLLNIERSQSNNLKWQDIKGQALTFRATCFLDAAQIWCAAYDASTAETELGIPLRLQSDFNIPSNRATLQETYNQIIDDLKESIPLLPVNPVAKNRPSKPAAYGLLSRTYLWMRDYSNALRYADSCLMVTDELLDYNDLIPSTAFPIPRHNPEVIFERWTDLGQVLTSSRAKIPLSIYLSFDEEDLRREIFFQKESDDQITFKGSYLGFAGIVSGIVTDEIYLTKAECLARDSNINEAIQVLNTFLEKRWLKGSFTQVAATSSNEALAIILEERRKQLLFRGHRWMDIKRLNKEDANISLVRTLKDEIYTLPANSPRFALPLPDDLLGYLK